MKERVRIGITGNARRWAPSWWCASLALRFCGVEPERINVRKRWSGKHLHGLIIGGGNDISPEHYGADIHAKVKADPERDKLEIKWIKWALERDIPMLGICRGAQLLNVVLQGKLHQDIRTMRSLTYNRPGLLPTKQVFLEPDSTLATICKKKRLRVNSLHHQAIHVPGEWLRLAGWDLDHITQAVECRECHTLIGVQWHPEYLFYVPSQMRIFRWLAREAREVCLND
jgi:putative glutamine amidotransferase